MHILKGACFHPFSGIISWLFNFDNICPKFSQSSRLFSFSISFLPSFLGTLYSDAVCFLHLFFHLCCFLVDLNLCPGLWLRCLPVSLGLQWVLIFNFWVKLSSWWSASSRVLFSLLIACLGLWVSCWKFSLDICYSLLCAQFWGWRSTKLLGSYVLGWGLLTENFTKVALSGELFYFADLPTGYRPGLCCFVFYALGLWYKCHYTLRFSDSYVSVLLCLPPLKTFSKAKVSDFQEVWEGRCPSALLLSPPPMLVKYFCHWLEKYLMLTL